MANRYGSENFALEFRDLQATTLSIDKNGDYALLAGRKYLAVISLEETVADKLVVRVPYGGKYEISNTQWSKENESKHIAIASSQRCDVFELTDSSELKCSIRLKGHTRVITDLDWCSLHPSLLATSSFDSFVHIWDIRNRNSGNADKPQFSLSALDGASQVRWNRQSEDVLASCDGGHVKIWDLRKPNSPSEFIAAHASKINGLEWANSDTVITAAQDCTVKFSKLSAETPNKAKGPILSLTAPVWRARPAPFGRGVVTQCVPILRRDSGLLSLWDWKRFASPIFTFQAYDIIEFAWRKTSNYDLITWSRDQTLRIWSLPREIVQLCGGDETSGLPSTMSNSAEESSLLDLEEVDEAGVELTEEDSPPPSPTSSSTPNSSSTVLKNKRASTLERRSRKSSSPSPLNRRDFLRVEYEKVESEKPENINFDQVELDKGLLRFSWTSKLSSTESKGRGVTAGILASFPTGYPSAPPTFLVTNASSEVDKNHVVKSLKNVAQQLSKKSEQCLGKCVEQFSHIMNSIKTLEDIEQGYFPNVRGVSNVPFPRTSGARFCAVGMLVCFGRPSYLKRVKSNTDAGTPRALSALGPYLNQVAIENDDIRHRRTNQRREKKRAGLVILFDVSPLLPFNLKLAEGYQHIITSPLQRSFACDHNSQVANGQKSAHASQVWAACSLISRFTPQQPKESEIEVHLDTTQIEDLHHNDMAEEEEENWLAYHPLGAELLHSMITHSAKYGDVQTAAAMACLCTSHEDLPSPRASCGNSLGPNGMTGNEQEYKSGHRQTVPGVGSPYHTVHGSDTLSHGHGLMINPATAETFFRQHRSNSWSDSLDDIKAQILHSELASQGQGHNPANSSYNSAAGIQIAQQNSHHAPSNSAINNSVGPKAGSQPVRSHSRQSAPGGHGHRHSVISENGHLTKNSGNNKNGDNNSNIINNDNGNFKLASLLQVQIAKSLIPSSRGVLLDANLHPFYDRYKKSYAELLYRWGLLQQRAEVLKNLTEISESNTITRLGVDFSLNCKFCGQTSKGPNCTKCRRIISICSICHTPARGLCTFCPLCGHGGHAKHLLEWFRTKKLCPRGCGCSCITENQNQVPG